MAHPAHQRFAFDDYLRVEEDSPTVKHEFLDGQVWAMAGGTPEHAAIAASVIALLQEAVRGKRCRVFTSDLRIRVRATGLATYPDASVVCDRTELDPEDQKRHTVLNPTVLVEVLSPSTEEYDRGEKLSHYQKIESLREVVLVAYDERRIDVWRREGEGWRQLVVRESGAAELTSLGCTLGLDDVYFDPLSS
jgi:Uma2 family endonuclease